MYKCKECGLEYETKPDYCDCGNDEFIEEVLIQPKPEQTQPEIKSIPKPTPASARHNNVTFESKIPKTKKTFSEQYPAFSRFMQSIDPISGMIFLICIIMSFVVVFCLWNPKEQIIVGNVPKKAEIKNIPSIDTFWNNSTEGMIQEDVKSRVEEPIVIDIPKVVQNIIPQAKITPKKIEVVTIKPTQTKPQVKTQQITQKQQPKQVVQQQVSKPQSQQATNVHNPQALQTNAVPQPTVTTPDPALLAAEEAKKAIEAKQELANYKAALRNTIGRKIDFTKVIGDGSCTVSFKIDSTGRLVNRAFAKQSSNITMNDAVYSAIMSTPSYNPPPSGYKNETLNLNIKFYNGNFDISLN